MVGVVVTHDVKMSRYPAKLDENVGSGNGVQLLTLLAYEAYSRWREPAFEGLCR